MVRKYIRKTDRCTGKRYTREALAAAIEDVRSKRLSSYRAAKVYNVPRTTIMVRMRDGETTGPGRRTSIPNEMEVSLANALKILQSWGFRLTKHDVIDFVRAFLTSKTLTPQPFKNCVPGQDWLVSFCTRHELTLFYNQRITGDPFVVFGYFSLLKNVLNTLNLEDQPLKIWNLTETSMELFQSDNRTANVTLFTAVNANGDKLPPFLAFERKQNVIEWTVVMKNCSLDTKQPYEVSENGWTKANILRCFLAKVFIPNTSHKIVTPTLILYDGNNALVDFEAIQFARRHKITLLKLPSKMTHRLQPLDDVFETLWEDMFVEWQRKNAEAKMSTNVFCELVTEIHDKTTHAMIREGFKTAGVYPLNPDAIPIDEYEPNAYKKWINKDRFAATDSKRRSRIFVNKSSSTGHTYDSVIEDKFLIYTHEPKLHDDNTFPSTSHCDISIKDEPCEGLRTEFVDESHHENEECSN
ncbi:DDE superfamily endonuclease domain-containing protein [Phthorimaea operculella]|nr:DDE superfamily endonuclease domain-containing protein [Phthorimaea operculella]